MLSYAFESPFQTGKLHEASCEQLPKLQGTHATGMMPEGVCMMPEDVKTKVRVLHPLLIQGSDYVHFFIHDLQWIPSGSLHALRNAGMDHGKR